MQNMHLIIKHLNMIRLGLKAVLWDSKAVLWDLKAVLWDLKAEQIFYILQKVFLHAFAYGDGYIPVYVYFNFLFPANTLNVISVD